MQLSDILPKYHYGDKVFCVLKEDPLDIEKGTILKYYIEKRTNSIWYTVELDDDIFEFNMQFSESNVHKDERTIKLKYFL